MATLKKNGVALTATDKSDIIAGLGLSSVVTIDPETGVAALNADKTPLYIDLFSSFGKSGYGTPSGLTSYPSKNDAGTYELTGFLVSGDSGATSLSINTGTVADIAGIWSAAIEYPDGIWRTHTVKNATGSALDVFPPLEASVYRAKLVNVQDAVLGQHLSEAGSFALADYLFDYCAKFADRSKYYYRIDATDPVLGWGIYGGLNPARLAPNVLLNVFGAYQNATQLVANETRAVLVAGNTNQGCFKSWDISGKVGYFETTVSSNDTAVPIRIDVLIDGYVVFRKDTFGIELVRVPFSGASTLECRVYSKALQTGVSYIGTTTLWASSGEAKNSIFSPGDSVVWLGDSWTYRQAAAVTRRLQKRGEGMGLRVTPIGKPGEQSTWAIANFDRVTAAKPTVVVIEYFVNDLANLGAAGFEAWKARIATLVGMVSEIGARPVVLMGAPTAAESQAQNLCNWSAWLAKGVLAD